MCKPSLLFLDEVTSGLDEQTDRDMMDLFRSVADTGKTVVCITHSLANVERTCHLVVILTAGGRLAFVGKPSEALEYFGIAGWATSTNGWRSSRPSTGNGPSWPRRYTSATSPRGCRNWNRPRRR